jgi:hypothetical protein
MLAAKQHHNFTHRRVICVQVRGRELRHKHFRGQGDHGHAHSGTSAQPAGPALPRQPTASQFLLCSVLFHLRFTSASLKPCARLSSASFRTHRGVGAAGPRIQAIPSMTCTPLPSFADPFLPFFRAATCGNSLNLNACSYVAHAESFTLGMTHGFTIKAPSTSVRRVSYALFYLSTFHNICVTSCSGASILRPHWHFRQNCVHRQPSQAAAVRSVRPLSSCDSIYMCRALSVLCQLLIASRLYSVTQMLAAASYLTAKKSAPNTKYQ